MSCCFGPNQVGDSHASKKGPKRVKKPGEYYLPGYSSGGQTSYGVITQDDLKSENVDSGPVVSIINTHNAQISEHLVFNRSQGVGRVRKKQIENGEVDPWKVHSVENGKLCDQDFTELRAEYLQKGELFEDPEFPPDFESLYPTDILRNEGIEWKRPSEISENPAFMDGTASRFDVKQGTLGDCWFLAALANLTLNDKLLDQVVPKDQSFTEDYAGIFHFRFWQFGEWVDVVVDDNLPTKEGKLIFLSSGSKQEFWSALLEKAYAKLSGSYQALTNGNSSEAMVDFTGGCSEVFNLKNVEKPDSIFPLMMKAFNKGSLMGCSIDANPNIKEQIMKNGLVRGHAYSITKVVKVSLETSTMSGRISLVRIRNPWGEETEWKGPWSDKSVEWTHVSEKDKKNLGLTFEADGEFFMSNKEFVKCWDCLELCHINVEDLDDDQIKSNWSIEEYHGSWTEESAGGCRNHIESFVSNPQYLITVTDPDDDTSDLCTVVISLMQKGRRDRQLNMLCIGVEVFHVPDGENGGAPFGPDFFLSNPPKFTQMFTTLREVTARLNISPGTYVIVPSTFEPSIEADFLLRIFMEKSHGK